MEIPEKEDKEKGAESLLKEIMTEKFPNLGRKMKIRINEIQRLQTG